MNTNPILLDIPHQFESSRLILRLPLDGDGTITFPAVHESQSQLVQWFYTQQIPTNEAETEEILRGVRADLLLRKTVHLLIFRQDTGEFVGEARLFDIDWSTPSASLGFWVRSSMQGQGFMTEAIERITEVGFDVLKLARLQLLVDSDNMATQRVAVKAGFTHEGTLRNHRRRENGDLCDMMVYSIIPLDVTG